MIEATDIKHMAEQKHHVYASATYEDALEKAATGRAKDAAAKDKDRAKASKVKHSHIT